ncbi:hypothetical protein ACWCQN_25385 [Streptomyces sp. NPDC001984]
MASASTSRSFASWRYRAISTAACSRLGMIELVLRCFGGAPNVIISASWPRAMS